MQAQQAGQAKVGGLNGVKALLNGRKGVVLLIILLLALITLALGVASQDTEMVEISLGVAGATAAVFFWAVAFEDGADKRAQVLFNEAFEARVDWLLATALKRAGLDENLITGIRALADSVIVTQEEEAARQAAMADKTPPWPEGVDPAAEMAAEGPFQGR